MSHGNHINFLFFPLVIHFLIIKNIFKKKRMSQYTNNIRTFSQKKKKKEYINWRALYSLK